jgi:hypothetical protein
MFVAKMDEDFVVHNITEICIWPSGSKNILLCYLGSEGDISCISM